LIEQDIVSRKMIAVIPFPGPPRPPERLHPALPLSVGRVEYITDDFHCLMVSFGSVRWFQSEGLIHGAQKYTNLHRLLFMEAESMSLMFPPSQAIVSTFSAMSHSIPSLTMSIPVSSGQRRLSRSSLYYKWSGTTKPSTTRRGLHEFHFQTSFSACLRYLHHLRLRFLLAQYARRRLFHPVLAMPSVRNTLMASRRSENSFIHVCLSYQTRHLYGSTGFCWYSS